MSVKSYSYDKYFELGEISAPLSFYTENWNPKEKLPLKLPGIRVEEKNLVVDLDEAIRKSREEQDLLRSQKKSFTRKLEMNEIQE